MGLIITLGAKPRGKVEELREQAARLLAGGGAPLLALPAPALPAPALPAPAPALVLALLGPTLAPAPTLAIADRPARRAAAPSAALLREQP